VAGFSQPVGGKSPGLVIDGKSISSLFKQAESQKQLETLSQRCQTVIACRLSPIQKSQLVRMIKSADPTHLTAAIGDGGNDVSMLQEAHVGLAIIGLEGTAAAQASDFAFTKFHFLRRALLVHGHWYYVRVSFLIQYSLYKNIACFTGQVLYMFYSNFSAQTLFESTFLVLYNTIYTSIPVMVYAILERPVTAEKLLANPTLYRNNRGNSLMTRGHLVKWLGLGLWHSLCSFFLWIWLYQAVEDENADLFCLQTSVSQVIVFIVNFKVLIESKCWTWALVLSVIISNISYCLITFIIHYSFWVDTFLVRAMYYNVYTSLMGDPNLYFATLIIIVVALLPDLLIQVWSSSKIRMKPKANKTTPFIDPVT